MTACKGRASAQWRPAVNPTADATANPTVNLTAKSKFDKGSGIGDHPAAQHGEPYRFPPLFPHRLPRPTRFAAGGCHRPAA